MSLRKENGASLFTSQAAVMITAIYVHFILCTHQCLLIERYALCVGDGSGHPEIHYKYYIFILGM